MKIAVKDWWYQQEQTKANKYNWVLCWGTVYENKKGTRTYDLELAHSEVIGHFLVGEKVKETEKAVQVELKFWNLNKAKYYRYITDLPVEDKIWKTWVPKSVLL